MSDLTKEEYRKAYEHGKGVGCYVGSSLPGRYAPLTFDSWYTQLIESKAKDVETSKGKALHKHNVVVRLFDPKKTKPKPSEDDITFSEDVCIIDENNVQGVAYFCFESMQWRFHTDTLVDYDEIGAETKWRWYYPPLNAEMIKF